jgi:hypothetical protein
MDRIVYTPTVQSEFKEPRNYPVMTMATGVALLGLGAGGKLLVGLARANLIASLGLTTATAGLAYVGVHQVLRSLLYPKAGDPPLEWNEAEWPMQVTEMQIEIGDAVTDVRLLKPTVLSGSSGKVHLFCLGNGMVYEQLSADELGKFILWTTRKPCSLGQRGSVAASA